MSDTAIQISDLTVRYGRTLAVDQRRAERGPRSGVRARRPERRRASRRSCAASSGSRSRSAAG